MLKKHGLGITPYIENISSRDQSLVRMGTSRVTLQIFAQGGAHGVTLSVCSSGSNLSKALNLHLSLMGQSQVSLGSVSGQSKVSLRSVSGRSVSGQSQVSQYFVQNCSKMTQNGLKWILNTTLSIYL